MQPLDDRREDLHPVLFERRVAVRGDRNLADLVEGAGLLRRRRGGVHVHGIWNVNYVIYLKEKIGRNQLALLGIAFIGLIVCYSDKTFSFEDQDMIGMLAAIATAFFYAITVVIFKKAYFFISLTMFPLYKYIIKLKKIIWNIAQNFLYKLQS